MSRQKTACRDRKWEEYNKSVETKKVYVTTKFSAGCQHKEEIVATKKLLLPQMKQEEGRNSVATRYLLSRQEIKEQYRKNTATDKFMLQHNLCRDRILFCRDIDYGNMENLVETKEELRRKIFVMTR